MKNKIDQFIQKNFTIIFTVFLFLQPFLDVATFFSINYFHKNLSVGMVVRFSYFIFCLFSFLLRKKEKQEKKYLFFIFFYLFLFLEFMLYQKGLGAIAYEGKVLLRTFYLPILFISLWPYRKEISSVLTDSKIVLLYSIYLFFILVPNLFGLGIPSYVDSKEGMIGWFYSANEVGAILSILMPFVFSYFLKKKQYLLGGIYLGITLITLLGIGTKVPIFSFFLVVFVFFLIFLIKQFQKKKFFVLLFLLFLFFVSGILFSFLIPKTSFYKNLKIHMDFLGMNSITEVFTDFHYLDHFVFSERLTLLSNTREIYQTASYGEKLLGLGYIKNYATDYVSLKFIEMDYYDIFYSNGIIGTIVYFLPFLGIVWQQRKKKQCLNFQKDVFLSILLVLILAFFSGHVLISPAVSFYAALFFLLIFQKNESMIKRKMML